MQRRFFLQAMAAGAGSASCGLVPTPTRVGADETADVVVAGMPRRVLGRTGERISVVGYAGFALREGTQADCTASLRQALEQGINYFDVAPAYADGLCEERMGQGFAEIDEYRRDSIFLACKTKARTRSGAREELERSLRRLRTDHFDLYQLHCLIQPDEDVAQALEANGAMETILRAREEGKVRYIGFSAHTTRAALTALQQFPFDTVMFPVNYVEHFVFGFGQKVLELAAQRGAGVVAIKPMSAGDWPADLTWEKRPRQWWYQIPEDQEVINLVYRFTLSQPGVVSGIPPSFLDLAPKAWEAGRRFRPITDAELDRLREMARGAHALFQGGELAMRSHVPALHSPRGPHEPCPGMLS